jgi:hypothetical protein
MLSVVKDILAQIYTSKPYKLKYNKVTLARVRDRVTQDSCNVLSEYFFRSNHSRNLSAPDKFFV